MSSLGERLDAAIRASGKTGDEIARDAKTTPDTVSRIRTGRHDNPELQLLIRVARAAKTTVGALLGESIEITAEDERELVRFRDWIDAKLVTVDALDEPNAVIVAPENVASSTRESRVADRSRQALRRIENPFGQNVSLVLRAIGESMIGAGILPDDTLYAVAPGPSASATALGNVIACRIGDGIFVKRLVTEHRRRYLVSAHPRYQPIAVDKLTTALEILGIVIGRVGTIE